MGQIFFYTVLFILLSFSQGLAQVDSKLSTNNAVNLLNQEVVDQISRTPSWQLTLDVIKTKAESLLKKNNQLTQEQEGLLKQEQDLKASIANLQEKNQELRDHLKERRGRSDEQMKIDELQDLITKKKNGLKQHQQEIERLNNQAQALEQKLSLRKLKNSQDMLRIKEQDLQLKVENTVKEKEASSDDGELTELKDKLQREKEQEAFLEKQINDLRQMNSAASSSDEAKQGQLADLEKKVVFLRQQKESLQKRFNNDNSQVNKGRYQKLLVKKMELEAKIKDSELRLNQLKEDTRQQTPEEKTNKQLLKVMIQMDTKNKQLRRKITNLNEDVHLLRAQVKRLERKVYLTGKGAGNQKQE